MIRWVLAGLLGCTAMAVVGPGCTSSPLSRDEEVRLLMAKNRTLEDRLAATEKRVAELAAAGAQPKPIVTPATDPFRAVKIRFNKFTGVLEGAKPGEERLKIILEPLDETGEIVKRAGSLDLEALEPGPPGQAAKPFASWALPVADLAQTWTNMLGVSGYVLKLPWPAGRRPAADALILRAKFTAFGGEVLTAETPVTIPKPRPPAPAVPKPPAGKAAK